MLERRWPQEYARTERIEQISEQPAEKKISLNVYYNTHGEKLEKLLDFPNAETDSPEVGREKQRRLLGQIAEAPAPEKISDAPPSWKGNGK